MKAEALLNFEMSHRSTYSVASQVAIAMLNERDKEKNERIAAMEAQMKAMTSAMNEMQGSQGSQANLDVQKIPTQASRSRGRPRGGAGGRGGRGAAMSGRGGTFPSGGPSTGPSFGDLMLNLSVSSGLRSSNKRKNDVIDQKSKDQRASTGGGGEIVGFWNPLGDDDEDDGGDDSNEDPRKQSDWKIQRNRGFQRDREDKNRNKNGKGPSVTEKKLSKTKKRNSTESLFPVSSSLDLTNEQVSANTGSKAPSTAEVTSLTTQTNSAGIKATSAVTMTPEVATATTAATATAAPSAAAVTMSATASTTAPTAAVPLSMDTTQIDGLVLGTLNPVEKVMTWNDAAVVNCPTRPILNKQNTQYHNPGAEQDIVVVNHDGGWREEIEIELRDEKGESFNGTITMTEAKYGIFRDCLGFKDFKNFDGVRFSFKGIRLVTFKLKEQVDVDELIDRQYFDYNRCFMRKGKKESVKLKCKVRGLRSDGLKEFLARKEAQRRNVEVDGSITLKITGCEYKVSAARLKEVLSHWGEVTSEPKEQVFHDPHDTDGTNRTGVYIIKMNPSEEIPELIPLDGLRLKVQHPDITKLCTSCYGEHLRKNCPNEKITWDDYVEHFRQMNPSFPNEYYGTSKAGKRRNQKKPKPKLEDFKIPDSQEAWDKMIKKMVDCGIERETASQMIIARKALFDKAVAEYNFE